MRKKHVFGERNVFGEHLQECSRNPLTGWKRDGFCTNRPEDGGKHLVCARMNEDFLKYTRSKGNDLSTPSDGFPGLKPGDNWCICAARYAEAERAGKAPTVVLDATNHKALQIAHDLLKHAR